MTNLADLLDRTATAHPDRTAVIEGDLRVDYAELRASADRVAGMLLHHGLIAGDRVALSCPNVAAFPAIYFGILKAGGTVIPLNILLKAREIAYHLTDSEARFYFAVEGAGNTPIHAAAREGDAAAPGCEHLFLVDAGQDDVPWASFPPLPVTSEVDDDATAVILYTSGTTGQPKGAELRHRNMRDNALVSGEVFAVETDYPDTYLCVLPLFHSFGQTVVQNAAVAFGGTIVVQPRFEARGALQLMLDHDVSFFAGVPTMYWALLAALSEPDAPTAGEIHRLARNLRVVASGGAALPVEIHKEFQARFGVRILEGYGLSETSPLASFSRYGEEPRVGAIGRPVPGVEMKLVNYDWSEVQQATDAVGEIAIRGHNIMKGYYKRPEATEAAIRDGWFRTGDIGRADTDGFYYVVDRAKDLIIRGGYNIYPRELEEVLLEHPAVSLVAVIGIPHPSHGEEVKAVIVPTPGATTTAEELVAWGREQFASYKYPRVVELVDQLPMTSTGKILKRELGRH
jgi:long-chain acyl-CoA synthetase